MCTQKQEEYLTKLGEWKGQDIDLGKIRAMTPDEASTMIDELKATRSVKTPAATKPQENRPLLFNDFRFGMCCKLVIKKYTIQQLLEDPVSIAGEILKVYDLVDTTESALKKALISQTRTECRS